MKYRSICRLAYAAAAIAVCAPGLWAQDPIPLTNWYAPPYFRVEATAKDVRDAAITGPLSFVAATPCRLVDTRPEYASLGFTGNFGQPAFGAATQREIPVPAGKCGIPAARAYSLNITVVPQRPLAYLTAFPTGTTIPNVSTLNSFNGNVVANAAVVPAGTNGSITIYVTDPTHVIVDINGYYQDGGGSGGGGATGPTGPTGPTGATGP
ncbi:MAG: hypothetical protein JNL62_25730, partial [Bryobacterales bacterium]|nr:hypothetical protein [Bryobacterales bacterium]